MAVFTGVGVAVVTLFDDDGDLDPLGTAQHASRLVDVGVRAVVVAGTTGEAWTLTEEEQDVLVRAVMSAVGGRVPVIVGVRGEDAMERAILAETAGADALLALSPPQEPVAYYIDLEGVGLPVLAYHYPEVSPPGLPVDMLHRLPVVGLKDSSGNFERLQREVREWDQPVYTGASSLVRRAADVGATGAILAIANLMPEESIAAWGGDDDAAARLESLDIAALKMLMHDRFGTSPTTRG